LLRQFGDRLFQLSWVQPDFCKIEMPEAMDFEPVQPLFTTPLTRINNTDGPGEPDVIAIQPLTIGFLVFYIIIIITQFLCMIWHR